MKKAEPAKVVRRAGMFANPVQEAPVATSKIANPAPMFRAEAPELKARRELREQNGR